MNHVEAFKLVKNADGSAGVVKGRGAVMSPEQIEKVAIRWTAAGDAYFVKVESVKGEYVKRSEGATKVYKVGAFDRSLKRWELEDTTDMNHVVYVKTGTELVAGFTY